MFELYDDILTVEELADALKIGLSQAYKLVRLGAIKEFKEGRDWKIAKQALVNYVTKRRI